MLVAVAGVRLRGQMEVQQKLEANIPESQPPTLHTCQKQASPCARLLLRPALPAMALCQHPSKAQVAEEEHNR